MLQFFCCLFDCYFELICHCYTYPVAFLNLVHLHRKLVLLQVMREKNNAYSLTKDEIELTQQRYKKLLWYAENQIQLASDELRSLIGIRPSGTKFTRGSFTFTREGKIGNQSAWSIKKELS